ncbi:MAG: hypothetical protein ACM37W_14060 [Actinomycetota bacterium]
MQQSSFSKNSLPIRDEAILNILHQDISPIFGGESQRLGINSEQRSQAAHFKLSP